MKITVALVAASIALFSITQAAPVLPEHSVLLERDSEISVATVTKSGANVKRSDAVTTPLLEDEASGGAEELTDGQHDSSLKARTNPFSFLYNVYGHVFGFPTKTEGNRLGHPH